MNLFEKAKRRAEESPTGYKHVWIIYDTDDFPKQNINVVPDLCKKYSTDDRQYHAIWSNQCIELWFLLHFSFWQSDLHRREYYPKLDEHLRRINAGKYQKNRNDMFDILRPYIDSAVKNAKKLEAVNANKTPASSGPGTMVYEFIEMIKPYI